MIDGNWTIAILPIKEHSERVTAKNFRMFSGLPLYHHIINTLNATDAIDEILVDTDSERVFEEAPTLSSKVDVRRRNPELEGDHVSVNLILADDLARSDGDIYVQTHATNPLLRPQTITRALEQYLASPEYDSLFGVNRLQSRFYTSAGEALNHDPEVLERTQDLDPLFEENSCLYVFSRASFASKGRRIGTRPQMFETPPIESVDIDDEFTFRLAELLAPQVKPQLTSEPGRQVQEKMTDVKTLVFKYSKSKGLVI